MKEAIANVGVFNLIIIFVIILMSFFIGSLGYSKAFKVKNKIVNEIEKEGSYEKAKDSIEDWLHVIGYRMYNGFEPNKGCPAPKSIIDDANLNVSLVNQGGDYQYCVYEVNSCNEEFYSGVTTMHKCSRYYKVIAYMYFDVPVVGDLIKIPVKGDTKPFVEITS